MNARTTIHLPVHMLAPALALLGAVCGGCSLGYNGALLMGEDPEAARAYDQFKRSEAVAAAKASQPEPGRRHTNGRRVQFHDPGPQYFGGAPAVQRVSAPPRPIRPAPAPAPQPASSRDVQFGPDTQPRPRDRSFLYGQVSRTGGPVGSPMDGVPNIQQISFATEGADFDPNLDQSGTLLAYASTQHRPAADIYVKPVHGRTVRQLTDDPADDATPAFSPDGKWIAYASKRSGNWDLYRISVDGGPSEQLTSSPDDELHPSFSPDGRRIVYCRSGSMSGQWELVLLDLDQPATPIIIGHGLFPDWSPGGNRIVYQRAREQGSRYFGIWIIDLEGSEAKRPTQIVAAANAAAITPKWNPDGTSLVFCTIIDPESDLQRVAPLRSDIWIINSDGTGRANLTQSRFANLQPVWAPDGSIYFVSNRSRAGMENIWAIKSDAAIRVVRANRRTDEVSPSQTAGAPAPVDGGSP